jgi:hypothetical protein
MLGYLVVTNGNGLKKMGWIVLFVLCTDFFFENLYFVQMMVPVTGHGSVGRVLCAMGDGVTTSTEAADVDHISYSYFHKKTYSDIMGTQRIV